MLQNDLTYASQEFTWPFPGTDEKIANIIKDLLQKHQDIGVAAAFFRDYEIESIQDSLPESWELVLDDSSKIKSKILRITIYSQYEEASRNVESDGEPAKLHAINLFDNLWVINRVETESDEEDRPLEPYDTGGEWTMSICFEAFYEDRFYGGNFDPGIEFVDGDNGNGIRVKIDTADLQEIVTEIKDVYEDMILNFGLPA